MDAWFRFRARAIRLFAIALLLAGCLPILYGIGLFLWQCLIWFDARHWVPLPANLLVDHVAPRAAGAAAVLSFIPQIHSAWLAVPDRFVILHRVVVGLLDILPLTLLMAALGVLTTSAGRAMATRQAELLRAALQRENDRLRRRGEYLKEDSRIEPW